LWGSGQQTDDPAPAELYSEEIKHRLTDVFEAVSKELSVTRERMKINHDKNLNVSDISPGQVVWIKRKWTKKGQSESLSTRWLGPWVVVKKMDNGVNFELRNQATGKSTVVHHDRIRSTPPPREDREAIHPREEWQFRSPINRTTKQGKVPCDVRAEPTPCAVAVRNDEGTEKVADRPNPATSQHLEDKYPTVDVEAGDPAQEELSHNSTTDEEERPQHLEDNDRAATSDIEAGDPPAQEELPNDNTSDQHNQNDVEVQPENIPLRRYPVRRRIPRMLNDFVSWDDISPNTIKSINTMYISSV
jgi:hypothetical protein